VRSGAASAISKGNLVVPRHDVAAASHPSPQPKIWVGGSSERAIRRALELGDVWHPSRGSDAEHVRRLREQHPELRVIPRIAPKDVEAMLETGAEGAVVQFADESAMREFARRYREQRRAAGAFVPEELHWKPVVMVIVCWAGDVEEGEKFIKLLSEFGNPVADVYMGEAIPDAPVDAPPQASCRDVGTKFKSCDIAKLTDEIIDITMERSLQIKSPLTSFPIWHRGEQ
jgi:hypothetical protein